MPLLMIGSVIFACVWMIGAWFIFLKGKNPAIVDLAWTLCVGGISFFYFFATQASNFVSIFVIFFMSLWTLRLAILLGYRLIINKEDNRYKILTAKWKDNLNVRYLVFFLLQGLGAVLLTMPIVFIMYIDPIFNRIDVVGLICICTGFIGVIVSDIQLQIFKRNSKNKEKVCNAGLWRYSRHPNYFFEWVFWVGLFLFASHLPWGFLSAISPLGLLYLLFFVTGIPPAEEQCLRSKKEAYKEYQKKTSCFIPWKTKD